MAKWRVYLMGFVTLLMAPLGWTLCGMPPVWEFLQLDRISNLWTAIGVEFGVFAGILMLVFTNTETARKSFSVQHQLIKALRLNFADILFLSLCAGFGEEILFRIAVQQWLHPILASIVFVAIHGYILPNDWNTTKYGILVCLFITVLSYAISGEQGLWFCIAAHASYDFVLFYFWGKN
ncbi:CPBP family intramembrane glutamic endopeptidase [Fluviicola sp.]|jgi:membrane protease YdiL (CAAX protease family)|uniref:CPBP family intramembrane glutamic endopeptidase n=1 Tax=Fluviicola sp. TaxID=1917219 RepID=UPI002837212E|nr:CPBP family intramembrane glutamic endopeptidase [Fluviicola sp.]MDR0802478.1 CPBP family intramembrane metalloprotease [Fluviicola sp.]